MEKKIQRIPHEGAMAGVCAGLGAYFGIDKTWMRVAFIVSVFFSGYMGIGLLGPVVYIVLWIVLPVKPFTLPDNPFSADYRAPSSPTTGDTETTYAPPAWDGGGRPNVPKTRTSKDRYVAGGILILLGIFFLLYQLNVFLWSDFARLWPVFIILLGVFTIFKAFKQQKPKPFQVNEPDEQAPEVQVPEDKPDTGDSTDNSTDSDHGYTK